jgi:hypothetical protein
MVYWCLLLFLLSGCASSPELRYIERTQSISKSYGDSIGSRVRRIYSPENEIAMTPCDFSWREDAIKVADEADVLLAPSLARSNEILKLLKDSEPIKDQPLEINDDLGNGALIDQWVDIHNGWRDAVERLQTAQSSQSDRARIRFTNTLVQLVGNDSDRIEFGLHLGLQRYSTETALGIASKIQKCYRDLECKNLIFSDAEEVWLRQSPLHRSILDRISDKSTTGVERRKLIAYLNQQAQFWQRKFQNTRNEQIFVENGILIVPMDMSRFGQQAAIVIKKLEEAWSVHGLKIGIQNSKKGYKVNVSPLLYRSHVIREKNEVNLEYPISMRTFVHEFGHVLGLRDTYYTSFHQQKCGYIDEHRDTDIMSNSRTGMVLPEHIEKIKSLYGL